MIYYVFEDDNIRTTIFLDEGSKTSFTTTKLAEALHLSKAMLTTIFKAGDEIAQPVLHKHHVINLKDRDGKKHKVKCIEVPFITSVQEQPNLSKIQELFPSIPVASLNRPNMEVGILLGPNANFLLPTGGTGEHKVNGLRIRRTVLGEYGYVLDSYHPEIWRPVVTNVKAWSKAVGILLHRWRAMAKELVCTPAIIINQSARPPKAQGKPRLVVFSGGSSVAYTAAVYLIY